MSTGVQGPKLVPEPRQDPGQEPAWQNSSESYALSMHPLKLVPYWIIKGSLVCKTSMLRTFKNCSYTTHQKPLIIHHSSYTTHHTPLIIHHSSYTQSWQAQHFAALCEPQCFSEPRRGSSAERRLPDGLGSWSGHARNRPSIVVRVFTCFLKCRFRGRHSAL